ncbi:MAG: hypothetical protein HXX81_06550, partial [Campylobacterales bacterium]|nr:hypothetical protein [Campylobacterales bacterium]
LLVIFILEIKRHKILRAISTKEIEIQQQFITFGKKIYMIDFSIIVLIYIVSKLF